MTVKSIKIIKNKIIKNSRGNIIKFISKKKPFFKTFGEIYFNKIKHKKTKGWILHKRNTCIFICIHGKIRFHFNDLNKKEKKILLDSNTGNILLVPNNIWFSFSGMKTESILANLIEKPHEDSEIKKFDVIKGYPL